MDYIKSEQQARLYFERELDKQKEINEDLMSMLVTALIRLGGEMKVTTSELRNLDLHEQIEGYTDPATGERIIRVKRNP